MVVQKASRKVPISLVMGIHSSGKTTWCRQQQKLSANIFVVPFDEMLYNLRGTYNITPQLRDVVVGQACEMIDKIIQLSHNVQILVDGWPQDFRTIEEITDISDNVSLYRMRVPFILSAKFNLRKKKEGRPYSKSNMSKLLAESNAFFNDKNFEHFVDHYDMQYFEFNPLETSNVQEHDKSVKEYVS